jgi:serine/threonine protein kinase
VLEDPGGVPADRLLGRPPDVSHFLRIAIPLAGALRHVHERGLIHKDIKPANILMDTASGGVWLTGFGIASRLPRERQAPAPPEVIAGTLAYMAPEQTGRMNRSVDSRSDLYALGVTFYELLTGQLPFTAADPMEWVVPGLEHRQQSDHPGVGCALGGGALQHALRICGRRADEVTKAPGSAPHLPAGRSICCCL